MHGQSRLMLRFAEGGPLQRADTASKVDMILKLVAGLLTGIPSFQKTAGHSETQPYHEEVNLQSIYSDLYMPLAGSILVVPDDPGWCIYTLGRPT